MNNNHEVSQKISVIRGKIVVVFDRYGQPQPPFIENKVEPNAQACANHLPSTNEKNSSFLKGIFTLVTKDHDQKNSILS